MRDAAKSVVFGASAGRSTDRLLTALNRRGPRWRATQRGGPQADGVLLADFAREKKRGIDPRVVEADRPVQVRTGHPAGSADRADSLATRDTGALCDIDAAQMVVHGDQSLAMVEDHGEPVEEIIADLDHGARRGRGDRRSFRSRDIQAAVGLPWLVVEEAPQSEPARDAPLRRQVESEGVQRGIAEGRKRPDKGFLLSRDPPEVFGLGFDLTAVGERHMLGFVVALADFEGDRARGPLAVEHGELVRAGPQRERQADNGVPDIPHSRNQHALAVEYDLRSRAGSPPDADDRDPAGHRR